MGILFISHSSRDNARAIQVRDWLRANGWSDVFLDIDPSQGLAPGHRWQEELKRAGERCSGVIVLVSPNWLASRWCQAEFLLADQLGKRVFPLIIATTMIEDLPLELRANFQIADISIPENEADGFERLAYGLKRAGLDPKDFDWPPADQPKRSVYRGLSSLDVQDAAVFFGRDAMITKGLDELRRLRGGAPQRLLVILGASGAGKSSFLRAGLISRLNRDEENFLVLPVLRPQRAALTGEKGLYAVLKQALGRSAHPSSAAEILPLLNEMRRPVVERFQRYAEAAKETYSSKPPTIVLPIDQAEEAFSTENAEGPIFARLIEEAMHKDGNFVAVATIRTDSYEGLQKGMVPEYQVVMTLPPLPLGSFKEVIEGPAKLAAPALVVEAALTEELLRDIDDRDAMPLLAFTLERLQGLRGEDQSLCLADYRNKLGGLSGAIESAFRQVFGGAPSKDDLEATRRLFIPALVQVEADSIRRRVARREILTSQAESLANRLVEQRLLISDNGTLEVAHEAILRQWRPLNGWIMEERESLVTLDAVRAAARDWGAEGRETSWLLHRGERLKEAEIITAREDFAGALSDEMRAYLRSCRTLEQIEGSRRRGMSAVVGVSALAVLAASMALITQDYWQPRLNAYFEYQRFAPQNGAEVLGQAPPGMTFQDCEPGTMLCPVMVLLPAGDFLMGAVPEPQTSNSTAQETSNGEGQTSTQPDERRLISVRRFAVSETEITFAHWDACRASGGCEGPMPSNQGWEGDMRPVINVSWNMATQYTVWLSQVTGHKYRLLTEAEWEYAARGVSDVLDARNAHLYSFGNDVSQAPEFAWFSQNSSMRTQMVRSKLPNTFGLYDMHGNVWEWVQDCYADYNPTLLTSAPVQPGDLDGGPSSCTHRVMRGGAWNLPADFLHTANRGRAPELTESEYVGFRVARELYGS
jgi:formylglycine-generating enzyme required for sulfatase activity